MSTVLARDLGLSFTKQGHDLRFLEFEMKVIFSLFFKLNIMKSYLCLKVEYLKSEISHDKMQNDQKCRPSPFYL